MSNSRQVLIVGSVDCNDGVNTFLVRFSLGKPARVAAEYGGPMIDIAAVGAIDTSALVESRFVVAVKAASVDVVPAIVASIADELASLSPITLGLKNSAYTGTLIPKIAECIELAQEAPWDSRLVNANSTLIEIVVRREPWVYGAEETLGAGIVLLPSFSPTGSNWPSGWYRSSTSLCTATSTGAPMPPSGRFVIQEHGESVSPSFMSPRFAVTPGTDISVSCIVEAMEFTGGGFFTASYKFYRSDGSGLGGTTGFDATASAGPPVLLQAVVTPPAEAAFVTVSCTISPGTGTSFCYAWGLAIAEIVDGGAATPTLIPLDAQTGQAAYPLELCIDAGAVEMTSFWAGRYPDGAADISLLVRPISLLGSWTAGAAANDANGYPDGIGDNIWRHTGQATAWTDVSQLEPGSYLVLARCKSSSTNVGRIGFMSMDALPIPTTGLKWLPLGVVALPLWKTYGGDTGTGSLDFTMIGGGEGVYAALNAVAFVPLDFGGMIGWKPASGHAHVLRLKDGDFYVDDYANYSAVVGSLSIRSLGGGLLLIAEGGGARTIVSAEISGSSRWEQFLA